jgi:flagellar motor protein MotB
VADERPIIVKKIKKVAAGHHGGAWKVAYADFVTAMMAFFRCVLNGHREQKKASPPTSVKPSRSRTPPPPSPS